MFLARRMLPVLSFVFLTAGALQASSADGFARSDSSSSDRSVGPARDSGPERGAAPTGSIVQGGSTDTSFGADQSFVLHPTLEVQRQSGDFEEWGAQKSIYQRQPLFFRWGNPVSPVAISVEVADGPFPAGQVLVEAPGPAAQPTATMGYFWLNLGGLLAPSPPASPKSYFVRITPEGGAPSTEVEITYMRDASQTVFTALGLDPNMLNPLRIYVDLAELFVEQADEEDDEEPYMINMLLTFDGTTIDVFDLANSSVRVFASQGTHGNVPHDGDLGSGDTAFLPGSTGYFQTTIEPINPEWADHNLFGLPIGADDLTRAATVVVISVALEEDATSTLAANAFRNALVGQLESELNQALQALTLADLLPLLAGTDDPFDLIPSENQELCDAMEALDVENLDTDILCRPGWAELLDRVMDVAISVAATEEIIHHNLFQSAASGLDSDDFIGVGVATFTMEELRTAPGPIDIEFRMKINNQSIGEAGLHWVTYEVLGEAGRCKETNEAEPCTPYYAPFVWEGNLYFP